MQAIKCSNCGFTGFADEGCCKRCGHDLGSLNKCHSPRESEMDGLTSRWLKNPAVWVALLVVVIVIAASAVVQAKLETYFDKTPAYLEAINKSPQFREALTVRVNQTQICTDIHCREIPSIPTQPGKATRAADILEGLGLLTMSTEATYTKVEHHSYQVATRTFDKNGFYIGISGGEPGPTFVDIKHERLIIALTDEGRKEAVNWKETVETYYPGVISNPNQPKLTWWRVPIGEREVIRIAIIGKSDANTVSVTFRWRWRPNQLGEKFDSSNAAVQSLPQKARDAAVNIGWNSQSEYEGFATLRRSGYFWTVWEVTEIHYPLEVTQLN